MTISLESYGQLVKGYLLGIAAPAMILESLDALMGGISKESGELLLAIEAAKQLKQLEEKSRESLKNSDDKNITWQMDPNTKHITPLSPKKKHIKIKRARTGAMPRMVAVPDSALPDIQERHNNLETNGSIAARYDVSDQTIINFLRAKGTYVPKKGKNLRPPESNASNGSKKKAKPKPSAEPEPAYHARQTPEKPQEHLKTDIMGEPLIDAHPPAPKGKNDGKGVYYYTGKLQPRDLMDIHDMLAQGFDIEKISERYQTTKKDVESFILTHRNAQMTRCRAGSVNPPPTINPPTPRRGGY